MHRLLSCASVALLTALPWVDWLSLWCHTEIGSLVNVSQAHSDKQTQFTSSPGVSQGSAALLFTSVADKDNPVGKGCTRTCPSSQDEADTTTLTSTRCLTTPKTGSLLLTWRKRTSTLWFWHNTDHFLSLLSRVAHICTCSTSSGCPCLTASSQKLWRWPTKGGGHPYTISMTS